MAVPVLLSLTQSRSSRSTYVTYSNIRGSHGLVLRWLRRRGRSLISGGMVLWVKDSTAPMSVSLRLPRYAGITFRRHHLLVGRPARRQCQERRSRLIERFWPHILRTIEMNDWRPMLLVLTRARANSPDVIATLAGVSILRKAALCAVRVS
jgi:hypothetical protein